MKFDPSGTFPPAEKTGGMPADASGSPAGIIARQAAELRAMALELTRAEQRERDRLAQILHDHLQQLLVAARMRLSALERLLGDPRQADLCRQIDLLLAEGVAMTRDLAIELQPPILAERGLAAALVWLGQQFQARHGLAVRVEADAAADPVSGELAVVLLAGVQELLLNVVKHAGVSQARVTMRADALQGVVIEVCDQGRGFAQSDPAAAATEPGYGLPSLRRRLLALGGRLEIETRPGRGTTARLTAGRM